MGRFKYLVDFPDSMESFKARYHIAPKVGLEYCPPDCVLTDRRGGEVVIPMIALMLPMDRITKDYLRNHRLCPHQCAPNMFRVLGCVDMLNDQMNLGLTWHNVVHLYECYSLSVGYYLKSRSDEVRLISCLPKSNKGMKEDFLIVSGGWHDGLPCPVKAEHQVGFLRTRSLGRDFSFKSYFYIFSIVRLLGQCLSFV